MGKETEYVMTSKAREDHARIKLWRSSIQNFLHGSRDILARHGVSTRGYHSMLEIWDAPQGRGIAVGELARILHVRHNTAVGVVDSLCKRNFAVRRRFEDDRRIVHVHLTNNGRAMLEVLVEEHLQELQKISGNLRLVLS